MTSANVVNFLCSIKQQSKSWKQLLHSILNRDTQDTHSHTVMCTLPSWQRYFGLYQALRGRSRP